MRRPINHQSTINTLQSTISVLFFAGVLCAAPALRELTWSDLAPAIQSMIGERGLDRSSFARYVAETRARNLGRVRDGDLDALVYFALQSSTFTKLPPIEPAVSAKAFVEAAAVPPAVRDRFTALSSALRRGAAADARLFYFRDIIERERASGPPLPRLLEEQYARAMRSLYEKEFAAAGDAYQRRGLSTDTSVEAGYVVYLGLASLHALEPARRVRRVLVVGPGLDLAPRTGLVTAGDPQSVQPFTVIDALVAVGMADRAALHVRALDINPRVADWIARARGTPLRLSLISSVAERDSVRFSDDYREYFAKIGRAVGIEQRLAADVPGHLTKSLQIAAGVPA